MEFYEKSITPNGNLQARSFQKRPNPAIYYGLSKAERVAKTKTVPNSHIWDTLLELEGFEYGTSLDINMGYYHIELHPDSRKYCTIVFPFGKYEYLRLPMGLCNSPDIFQEHMSGLMADLEFVRAYINDVAVLSTSSWEDHLKKVDKA